MSQVDRLKAKRDRIAAEPADAVLERPVEVRSKAYRLSVDLAPALHGEVLHWSATSGAEVGRRIPAAEIVRVLLRRMLADEDLSKAVIRDLAAQR
jgi:hypothetical protein